MGTTIRRPEGLYRTGLLILLLALWCSCGTSRHSRDTVSLDKHDVRKILRTAEKQKGVPYRWGGNTPAGFDCSGFTRYCFAAVKVPLPGTAEDQSGQGKKVKERKVRKGDLVFFTGKDHRSHHAGHVGIVLSVKNGNVRFIHAATNGVMISNLSEDYYRKRLLKIRRIG